MKQIIKNTLILFAITLVAGAILAVVYNVTKEPIAKAEQEAEDKAFLSVCPAEVTELKDAVYTASDDESNCKIEKIKIMYDSNGQAVGYAVKAKNKGYGGDIEMVVGVGPDKKIIGFTVISASNESPGLGANCLDDGFASQYIGKESGVTVSKTGAEGNQIDAISGATITSSAVTAAVNYAVDCVAENFISGGVSQ